MGYQWDADKAAINLRKHGIHFADAIGVLEDDQALWREDRKEYGEERFVAVGLDYLGRILIVAFTFRGDDIRLISARRATKSERKAYDRRTF